MPQRSEPMLVRRNTMPANDKHALVKRISIGSPLRDEKPAAADADAEQVEEREARLLFVAFGLERELVERLASIGFVTLDHFYSASSRVVRVHNTEG